MTTWFSADPHFDHFNIIKLANRPFHNVNEMNEYLINSYNTHVKSSDTLFMLGDFGWGDATSIKYWRERIHCQNIEFIWGNHDKVLKKNLKLAKSIFKSFEAEWIGDIQNQHIHMYHFPVLEWNSFFRDSWNLYGHVHNNRKHPNGFLGHDVGVDANGYKPVSFEEVRDLMFRIKEKRLSK